MLAGELAADRSGIAWTVMPQAKGVSGIRPVALAARDGGPFVLPSRQTFQDRTYPLVRNIHYFLNRPPGKQLEPRLREFLRFVLSREGQEIVARDGGYLPLTAAAVLEQVKKLD
jgi:phosphate transport system substrate-binding protein